jgi:hypothetical protein
MMIRKFLARFAGWMLCKFRALVTFARKEFRHLGQALFIAVLLISNSAAIAQTSRVSVSFNYGVLGEIDNAAHQPERGKLFSSLNITRATISQLTNNGQFGGTQGNDYNVDITLFFTNGTSTTFAGAVNWRDTSGSTLLGIGVIGAVAAPADGTTYVPASGKSTSYLFRLIGKTHTYNETASGVRVLSGNAASNGLLDDLNAYLAASIAAAPAGPVTVTALKTNDTTPTITGTATLGTGDSLQVTVNGVVYTTSNGLVITGSTWSLTLPTLAVGTYSVDAQIIGSSGYTKVDTTTGELQIDTTGAVITGPSGSGTTTGNASKSVNENTFTVATFTAPETVTWSVEGLDASKFTISAGGVLTFIAAPDYENPTDQPSPEIGDNIYELTVKAVDLFGNVTTQIVAVTVLNVEPEAASVGSIAGKVETRTGTAVAGATVKLINASGAVVGTTTSGVDGTYSFAEVAAGTYSIEFVTSSGRGAKGKSATGVVSGRFVQSITVEGGATITSVNAVVVDPSGVVYASNTRAPVAGAVVRLLYNNALVPDSQLDTTVGGANTQTVGADGLYSFVLNGTAPSGEYTLSVTPPSGYTFASTAIVPTASSFTPSLGGGIEAIQAQATAPTGTQPTTYYLTFDFTITSDLATTSNGVVQNHIPLDPVASASTSTITASPTSVAADGTSTSTITVQLKDANGNNLTTSGGVVTLSSTLGTLSSVIDHGDGTYTATLTSNAAGDAVISGLLGVEVDLQDTETVTFFNGPVLTGPNGSGGTTTGAAFAISLPEGGTAVTQILSDVAITTWAISGEDSELFTISSNGTITFNDPTDYEVPADLDGDNIYLITVSATDGAGNTVTRTLTVTITDVTLPGTPPASGTDLDGDGVADSVESSSADRDGDGIPDAQDYDPQGYFYCQADGRILPGGQVTVTGPGSVNMVKDGTATGEYQWFVDAPGTYVMAIDPSGTGYSTVAVNSAGTLTLAAQSGNPIVIGHTQNAATGYLGEFNGVAYNPAALPTAYYTSFVIAEGDAYVFGNNIPMANCTLNTLTITKVTDGREPMGGALGQDGRFRVTLDRVAEADVIITFTVSGTGSEGTDYTTLTRSVTILAGSLSADIDVAVLPDSDDDSGETVIVTLASLSNPAVTLGSVTSATVTLTDGLVEGIAERLADVLQDDFNQTIALQSRQFASMSRGALGRLQYMGMGWDCISTDDADFDGDGAVTDAASQLGATYLRERVDCARTERVLEYGALAVSTIDGQGAQVMLSFGRAREEFEDGQINGRFWGGYLTTNGVDGDGADGRIAGVGANLGIYSARKLGSDLYLDTYAAAAIGFHGFDLMFDDSIRAEGDYGYIGVFAGAALSGEIAYDTATLRPRLGVDMGYGSAGRATVRAYAAAASETGFVTIDPAIGLHAYAELGILFGEQTGAQVDQTDAPAQVRQSFGLTPRIFCEDGFGTQEAACGYGLGLEFNEIEAARDIAWHMSLNAERVGNVTRGDMHISRERAFWHGAGAWSSGVTAGSAGDISAAHGVKVTW